MEYYEVKAIVEALLFASGQEGVSMKQITRVLDIDSDMVSHLLSELIFDYENKQSGMMLMESQDTYFLATKPEYSHYVHTLLNTPQSAKLSQAALETLAIIAYQQPITRTEIEEIRGVKSDRPVQTLLGRLLIEEVGRKDSVGRPILFGTSKEFLTYFGLSTLKELPELPDDMQVQDTSQEADLFFDSHNKQPDHDT